MAHAKLIELAEPKPVHCAIYTRKSTEEGLDQEFNSLDAQRECAEAYIQSQRHERWTLAPQRYDDGGFTGANLDRPALKHLLADIEAGCIDCVVVYKVDRLSRSLLDFARIMEVFDKRGVSFVSVTQQLNTNSPMGRLTLNVLLSFAEFERQIVSERTRDKISAARRKGKWTGGFLPLGYDADPVTRRLVVNEAEADGVQQIFGIFLRKRSLVGTIEELDRLGITSKVWTTKKGRKHAATSFDRAGLVRLLTNRIYVGEVNHKGTVYPGEQPAIVSRELWEQANQMLTTLGRRRNESNPRVRRNLLLSPVIYCAVCGSRMISGYASSHGGTYPYYVCLKIQKRGAGACPGQNIRAERIEQVVVDAVRSHRPQVRGNAPQAIHGHVERIDCNVARGEARMKLKAVGGLEATTIELTLPRSAPPQGPQEPIPAGPPRISQLMALAIDFERRLEEGTVRDYVELARLGGVTRARVTQIMNLRRLAPSIQEKLLFLDSDTRITERDLRKVADEIEWTKQIRMFDKIQRGL